VVPGLLNWRISDQGIARSFASRAGSAAGLVFPILGSLNQREAALDVDEHGRQPATLGHGEHLLAPTELVGRVFLRRSAVTVTAGCDVEPVLAMR
jgi:hypothetical protein